MSLRLLLPILLCLMFQGGAAEGSARFAQRQDAAPRMQAARASKGEIMRARFDAVGIAYPAPQLLLRIFKREALLELWAASSADEAMTLVATYPVCADSGELGPKRRRGDLQVPEGFYVVSAHNPNSSYHLALGVSYPNRSDRILGRKLHDRDLGGNIAIHGDCVEGVCCSSACTEPCASCRASATGQADGTCAAILAGGEDYWPTPLCTAAGAGCPATSCACDGQGSTASSCRGSVGQACVAAVDCVGGICECADAQCSGRKCAASLCVPCAYSPTGNRRTNHRGDLLRPHRRSDLRG